MLPNTDAALQLAIIYTWLKEDTWDKEYVATHAVGMDKIEAYVLGEVDGTPKTPKWAEGKCGVPSYTIKALARKFAKQVTSIIHYFGGSMVRGPFSHEPGRLECVLLGMQGLGAPGVWQWQISYAGMPRAEGIRSNRFFNPFLPERIRTPTRTSSDAWGKQLIPKTMIQEAIFEGKAGFHGSGGQESLTEDQFIRYDYPIAKEEGGTEFHMIWSDTPCRITCWNHGNWTIDSYRSPKIETYIVQHPWLENDTLYADIILPSNTTLEVEDIVTNTRQGPHFQTMWIQEQACQPVGESKSDYEVVVEVAKKLGMEEQFTEGKDLRTLEKEVFDAMEGDQFMSFDEFYDKKYLVFPTAEDWQDDPVGIRGFYEDPENHPWRPTRQSGVLLREAGHVLPQPIGAAPVSAVAERTVTHDERVSSERADMFPLLLMSQPRRWRTQPGR